MVKIYLAVLNTYVFYGLLLMCILAVFFIYTAAVQHNS